MLVLRLQTLCVGFTDRAVHLRALLEQFQRVFVQFMVANQVETLVEVIIT